MSYLLDKKTKRKKSATVIFFVVIFLILVYFRSGIWSGLSRASGIIFRPVLVLGNTVGGKFANSGAYFLSKDSLSRGNENIKSKLLENEAKMSNYGALLDENISLKEILGRIGDKKDLTLSAILSKPNQSLYDTLIIDAGANVGVKKGDMVLALGDVPLGKVAEVLQNSSKVILFTNPGEKTQVVVGNGVFMQVVGRGGGNFEMILPRDFTVAKGDQVVLPGIMPRVLGIVETIISDPRDPFQKALLVSPVNIQEIKFVQVEI